MLKRKIRIVLYLLICLMIVSAMPASVSAQEESHRGSVGITASLQGTETSVMFPWWVDERFVLTPAISFVSISDAETEFGFAFGPRFNLKQGPAVPYFGLRFGLIHRSVEAGEATDDIIWSAILGGEYFIGNKFSVGVEMQANVAVSDEYSLRFGNPGGTNLNTASAVAATFYF